MDIPLLGFVHTTWPPDVCWRALPHLPLPIGYALVEVNRR